MNYDGCAPSTTPSVSSFPTSSTHPSWAPSSSSLPTLSTYPSSPTTTSPTNMPSTSLSPTIMPSISIAPSAAPSARIGPQEALFDSDFGAPRCKTIATSCDTGSLVIGRGTMSSGESNYPNTIDGCADGNSGSFHSDESNDRIVVKSSGGGALRAGNLATIEATVYAYSASDDTADFFYAADATNPVWFYIGSARPSGTGLQNISVTYTLPMGAENQAVRVQFRYASSGDDDDDDDDGSNDANMPSTNPCDGGYYNERDDLVFKVVIPSSTFHPSLAPFVMQVSESPSESHSLVPTLLGSEIPSMDPSQTQSIMPSKMHSYSPSKTYSAVPSLLSSQSPSFNPSKTPSQ
eukprot:scaffold59234_cov56-Cyclotella_meneghiniana.AAC.1